MNSLERLRAFMLFSNVWKKKPPNQTAQSTVLETRTKKSCGASLGGGVRQRRDGGYEASEGVDGMLHCLPFAICECGTHRVVE